MSTSTPVSFNLRVPEDGPSMQEIRAVARRMRLTPEEYMSRCIVEHTMRVLETLDSGELQAWVDAAQADGPVDERMEPSYGEGSRDVQEP
ncbi:hypothetical protein CKO28_00090 [Rhodovibrio sodomensis]|uniref:CopG family transcriptional regulator n=1 Tax=Rhodovibrio sodomensis TaxID=1088 RepID=A0ABS1DA08_9PROT|nr:hypothetical protein [Rhodovibrio sodomensis]MBK1666438.1 hypothetical protein [Rhodovibrio sodomensis]